jgi:energy-coupling factor transporter ATP-binding protein EcfA2
MLMRPLAQSRADQRRFVDRTRETQEIVRAVAAAEPVLVLGEPGSGRTTLLNHAAWLLAREPDPRESLLVPGELARDPAQLLGVLVARLQRLAEPDGPRGRWLDDLRALSMPDGPFGHAVQPAILMELVDLLGERLADLQRPVCLMIDGISPAVAHGLFGSLRNELWALEGAGWVVAGDAGAGPLYREPPADAFFERVVELGPLSETDGARLLRAHVPELSDTEIEAAVAAGGGNPRRLLRAAADIQAGRRPTPSATGQLANQAVDVAGPLAGALVEYLAGNGPAAASDKRLLSQIGASRQRASQLMHQLESAGLLETLEQHEPGRRGRPSRRFAVKTPT